MRKQFYLLQVLSVAACLSILAPTTVSQESRGSIQGTVTDAQGAVIPGATITIANIATNASRIVTSSEIGYYEAPLLDAGSYSLTVEIPSFKKYSRTGIVLNVGTKIVIDITLEVGGADQTVTVTAGAPLLDTASASSGRVIDMNMIARLPFSDLNPFALTGMAAGMQWTGHPDTRRLFIFCKDLLGADLGTREGRDKAIKDNLFRTLCPGFVRDAAQILSDMKT